MPRRSQSKKIIAANLLLAAMGVVVIEALFGRWYPENFGLYRIPGVKCGINQKIKKIVESDAKSDDSTYTRRRDCYRVAPLVTSYQDHLVLTIGGSTTDQVFLDDSNTWQAHLQKLLNRSSSSHFTVLNGGVDGQSSFGHLVSTKLWHSRLPQNSVAAVIVYLGVNEWPLLLHSDSTKPFSQSDTWLNQAKSYISESSAFKPLYFALKSLTSSSNRVNSIPTYAHNFFNKQWTTTHDFQHVPEEALPGEPSYKTLIENLLNSLHSTFPRAKIVIVQQQVPGCLYDTNGRVADLHPNQDFFNPVLNQTKASNYSYCTVMFKSYQIQKKVLREVNQGISSSPQEPPISLVEMYKHSVLGKTDVYDYVHTNSAGSRKIAEFLFPMLNDILNKTSDLNAETRIK